MNDGGYVLSALKSRVGITRSCLLRLLVRGCPFSDPPASVPRDLVAP